MKIQNISKLTVLFLFLALSAHTMKIAHLQETNTTNKEAKSTSDQQEDSDSGVLIIIPIFGQGKQLPTINVSNLNDTQKEIDAFIRNNSKVGNSNLTEAEGDGQDFVYKYQNNTQNASQIWVVTVCGCKKQNKQASTGSKDAKNNSTTISTTNTQKSETPKWVITGVNYIRNSKLTEEEKKKMAKQFKKQQQKFDQFQEEMKKGFKQLTSIFDDW